MRHFLTINASRPYVAGGLTFVFEPVQNRGGSWLGVLAVDDSAASTLAASALYGVEEITEERFDQLKKKGAKTPVGTSASPRPQRVPTPAAGGVRLVEQRGRTPGVGNPLIVPPAPVPESVALQSTTAQPPFESLLDGPAHKEPNRFRPAPKAMG